MTQDPGRGKRERATEALERLRERFAGVDEDGWFFAVIAEQVADRRKELGLSQAELADLVATTQSAIARLESGGRPPRIDTLLRIANALDCELLVELRPRTKSRAKTKKRGGK
jgi:ribosome-binding protein aMBF1 (putative translation factor)